MRSSKRFACPMCEYTSGRAAPFEKHMSEHGFESVADAYVALKLSGLKPRCGCNACDEVPTFYGWNKGYSKFVLGHNGSIYSAYGEDEAGRISSERRAKLTGRVGWSRGLSKETSESLARGAQTRSKTVSRQFESGERSAWNKGSTHETSETIEKCRNNLIEGYASGRYVPWAKGLTKETDERVLTMSLSVSLTLRREEVRTRLDALKRLSVEEILKRLSASEGSLILESDPAEYVRDRVKNLRFRCVKCGSVAVKSLIEASSGRCGTCSPAGSQAQVEVERYVRFMGLTTSMSDRSFISPYEIDIVIPEKRIGIEYNGLYFHSALFKSKNYHSNKSRMCQEVGVRLIHVFEDEWRDKRAICESIISHKTGMSRRSIGARECAVVRVDPAQKRAFFNETHIDGDVKSSACFGLQDKEGNLVACMSLRRPLHKKFVGHLEIARYSTRLMTNVVGGLGRLTSAARKYAREVGASRLMTYVDTRWGSGDGYVKSGWQHVATTPNRFWWTDGRVRIDRFKIRADSEQGLTEQQVADLHGVVKIWGCPNILLSLDV